MKALTKLFITSLVIFPAVLMAGNHTMSEHSAHANHGKMLMQGDETSSADFVTGEVKRINLRDGKVTLKHGKIPSHQMPPMTMDFKVLNPDQLNGLKRGSKVKFSLNEKMEITQLQTE